MGSPPGGSAANVAGSPNERSRAGYGPRSQVVGAERRSSSGRQACRRADARLRASPLDHRSPGRTASGRWAASGGRRAAAERRRPAGGWFVRADARRGRRNGPSAAFTSPGRRRSAAGRLGRPWTSAAGRGADPVEGIRGARRTSTASAIVAAAAATMRPASSSASGAAQAGPGRADEQASIQASRPSICDASAPGSRSPSSVCSEISPSRMWITRSAALATRASWVTRTIVWPCRARAAGQDLPRAVAVEVAGRLVGQQHRGRLMSARAMATRCCWPPESALGTEPAAVGDAEVVEQLAPARGPRAATDRRTSAGSSTLSAIVRFAMRLKNWKTKPTCAGAAAPSRLAELVDPARRRARSRRRSAGRGRRAGAAASTCRTPRAHDADELARADAEVDAAQGRTSMPPCVDPLEPVGLGPAHGVTSAVSRSSHRASHLQVGLQVQRRALDEQAACRRRRRPRQPVEVAQRLQVRAALAVDQGRGIGDRPPARRAPAS